MDNAACDEINSNIEARWGKGNTEAHYVAYLKENLTCINRWTQKQNYAIPFHYIGPHAAKNDCKTPVAALYSEYSQPVIGSSEEEILKYVGAGSHQADVLQYDSECSFAAWAAELRGRCVLCAQLQAYSSWACVEGETGWLQISDKKNKANTKCYAFPSVLLFLTTWKSFWIVTVSLSLILSAQM